MAVTAGEVCAGPRAEFYRFMDAANVDLKGFSERFYREVCAGSLAPVLETLQYLKHETSVWFELTTLLDSRRERLGRRARRVDAMGGREARARRPAPLLRVSSRSPHARPSANAACDAAPGPGDCPSQRRAVRLCGQRSRSEADSTRCHQCGQLLIGRDWYRLTAWNLTPGREVPGLPDPCAGVFEPEPGSWGPKRRPVRLAEFASSTSGTPIVGS